MSKNKRGHRRMSFCCREKIKKRLQIPRGAKGGRTSFCALCKGSITLEASLALPFLLCAVASLLWLFSFTAIQAKGNRSLMEKAQLLAVTVASDTTDPYVRLYGSDHAAFSFMGNSFGGERPVRKAVVRAWVGYTGESFRTGSLDEIVFITPEGAVYHRNRDCTYLKLSIRQLPYSSLEGARNQSGGKYAPCEYCIPGGWSGSMVYITDYGNSYHSIRNCRGLKRTVMAVPLSKVGGRRCCSRCG